MRIADQTMGRLNTPFSRSLMPQPFRKETGDGAVVVTRSGSVYKLDGLLGVGGLSVVYLATRYADKSTVALKVPNLTAKQDGDALALLLRESRILSKLDHPSIIRLVEHGYTTANEPFLVTDWVRAQTLDLLLFANQRFLPLRRAAEITLKMAAALEHAHSRGVIHRDIKPENVMVSTVNSCDTITLFDFGIATDSKDDLLDSGSLFYCSPEQLQREPCTERSDVYQLALVLLQMLIGDLPFERSVIGAIRYRQGSTPLVPPDDELGATPLPPSLRDFLQRCLSPIPDERPCSMNVFAYELRQTLLKLRLSRLRLETLAVPA